MIGATLFMVRGVTGGAGGGGPGNIFKIGKSPGAQTHMHRLSIHVNWLLLCYDLLRKLKSL